LSLDKSVVGEHLWAGGYRRINTQIEKGYTLITGTDQGIFEVGRILPGAEFHR
jgi:hypothetical protein